MAIIQSKSCLIKQKNKKNGNLNPFDTLGVAATPFPRMPQYIRCHSNTFILVLYDFIWYSPVAFVISTPQWLRWQHALLTTIICQIWKILGSHIGYVSLIMQIPCMDASK